MTRHTIKHNSGTKFSLRLPGQIPLVPADSIVKTATPKPRRA